MPKDDRTQLIRRVRSEYAECPGLNLTKPQMRRFLGVDEPTCSALVDQLLAEHVLILTARGQFVVDRPSS
jgi:hypothetical protein